MNQKGRTEEAEILFQPFGSRLKVPCGITITSAAKLLSIDISTICGDKGTCGKCKVRIESGSEVLNPLFPAELRHLTRDEIEDGYRLGCLVRIPGDLAVAVPERSRAGRQRLQTEGIEAPVTLDPYVRKYFVEMPKATLVDQRSDERRLLDALRDQHGLDQLVLDFESARQLPEAIREGDWGATAVVYDERRVIGVEPGDTSGICYGFAVDVGTTKLAGYLVDLVQGKTAAVSARDNPQIPFGEDVITRISHAMGGNAKLKELQKVIVKAINGLMNDCCRKAGVSPRSIYDFVAVGNTCMHHLLLGISPQHLALSPYVPVLEASNVKASRLGLKISPNGGAYMAPVIGGFVGGDCVAGIMVSQIFESEANILAIDVGTNTEVALVNRDGVMVASCASGPAFEGMHVKHGMKAAPGAIERVSIDPKTLEVNFSTVDGAEPLGICGTGLIDAMAGLLKSGMVDTTGRFVKDYMKLTDRLRQGFNGIEFVIVPKDVSATGKEIALTQADVRELQKAKAAVHTGISLLMKRTGTKESDIKRVFVAGAFGNYIDSESARTIGMYPELPLDKFIFAGNSAGVGARMMLLSKVARRSGEKIARETKHLELATDENFSSEFFKSLYLPHQNLHSYPIFNDLLQRVATYRR